MGPNKIWSKMIDFGEILGSKLWCIYWLSKREYCKTSNISCTLVGNKIVDHSAVVGASPVGAAPTTSSFSTLHLASRDSAKTAARQYENLVLGFSAPYIRDLTVSIYYLGWVPETNNTVIRNNISKWNYILKKKKIPSCLRVNPRLMNTHCTVGDVTDILCV